MPLEAIYLTRHGHRLNWSVDPKTGEYRPSYPTPTGVPVDPPLTLPGVRQSRELAAYLSSPEFTPKPCRIYSSAFYRCLQTIQPAVEALQEQQKGEGKQDDIDLDVRIENGLGEWFGHSSSFTHPAAATPAVLHAHFPTILRQPSDGSYKARIYPSPHGETIAQLHDRIALALDTIIRDVDAEIAAYERDHPAARGQPRAILICSHAAPLIAMGRALTGNIPDDTSVEDFHVFTTGLSTFVRRKGPLDQDVHGGSSTDGREKSLREWRGGKGVQGGWDCVQNGYCGFLSGGEERGWHFNGEEDFNSMPTPPTSTSGDATQAAPAKL